MEDDYDELHEIKVSVDATIASELILAVPASCESLYIGEFVALKAAEGPPPQLHLPKLRTLQIDCCRAFLDNTMRMIKDSATGLPTLTHLVIELKNGNISCYSKVAGNEDDLFCQLLSGVAHLKQLQALTARGFTFKRFSHIVKAAPQLRQLRLVDCMSLGFDIDDCSALNILKGQLEVMALQGEVYLHSSGTALLLLDYSMGLNLRVLDLSGVRFERIESLLDSPMLLDQFQLPPSLRELNLTGCTLGSYQPLDIPQSLRELTVSQGYRNMNEAYVQALTNLSIAFVEVDYMPVSRSELQNLAGSLTRLELLPTIKRVREMLSSMPRLRCLSTGCGRKTFDLLNSLSDLTKLQLAFDYDLAPDLSHLTGLKELTFASLKGAIFDGHLPPGLTSLTLVDTLERDRVYIHDLQAPEAVTEAQSNMLRPLQQLRRLVWLEHHPPASGISLPWPELPLSLEELVLMPRGYNFNWAVLLPLENLRCLTTDSRVSASDGLQTVLALMPWLHTVKYHGPRAGEAHHELMAHEGSPWLRLLSLSHFEDDDEEYNYDDGDWDIGSERENEDDYALQYCY